MPNGTSLNLSEIAAGVVLQRQPITGDDLAELRRLHTEASPAPWGDIVENGAEGFPYSRYCHDAQNNAIVYFYSTNTFANSRFVVAARNTLPGLLNEIDALREENSSLKKINILSKYIVDNEGTLENLGRINPWADNLLAALLRIAKGVVLAEERR